MNQYVLIILLSFLYNFDSKNRIYNLQSPSLQFNYTPGKVIYVDSSAQGTNDGNAWVNAFTKLQDALNASDVDDTIKVARGTYFPDEGIGYMDNSRVSFFHISNSRIILGGFPTGGGSNDDRQWKCNQTILSGDIGVLNVSADNSYHVVVTTNVDSTTVVDGFYIINGTANGLFPHDAGGGWYNNGSGIGNRSNPTIRNCVFSLNIANAGGAMFNNGFNQGNSSPLMVNCIFSGNTGVNIGGAFYNRGGGGGSSNPVLINCILSGNKAISAPGDGGVFYNDGGFGICIPKLINCVLNGNLALRGGAMYNNGSTNASNGSAIISNSILWNNHGSNLGPVIYNGTIATPTLSFCIIQGSSTNINHSSITGGYTTTVNNGNNKFQASSISPLFIYAPLASAAPTAAGNFHLLPGSTAIDMGTSLMAPVFDLDGKTRPLKKGIDVGAYEFGMNCSRLNDLHFQCIHELPLPDTNLISENNCNQSTGKIYVLDQIAGTDCISDPTRIIRYYIKDFNGDTILDKTDQDTCVQIFYIIDSIAPLEAIIPKDTAIDCNSDTSITSLGFAVYGYDNCFGHVFITHRDSMVPGDCPTTEIIFRSWYFTDRCGNFRTQVQTINLLDRTPPNIQCPRDTTVSCREVDIDTSSLGSPLVFDLCSTSNNIEITYRDDSTGFIGSCQNDTFGYITRTFIATDVCGNTDSCKQMIAFVDTLSPCGLNILDQKRFYFDGDNDGHGTSSINLLACSAPVGFVEDSSDCNDTHPGIFPGATEIFNGLDDNCDGQIDEGLCNISVSAGIDEHLFFGYALEQCKIKTAIVTGGTAPFTYIWTLNRPLLFDIINSEGDETMTDQNTANVKICLLDTAELCVTVTDANGCVSSDCVIISAEDVRCFAGNSNNQKVNICHKGNTICVDQHAVSAHLDHGDYAGPCIINIVSTGKFSIDKKPKSPFDVFPNPNIGDFMISLNLTDLNKKGHIQIINAEGKLISRLSYYDQKELKCHIEKPGIYFVRVISGKEIITKKMIVF